MGTCPRTGVSRLVGESLYESGGVGRKFCCFDLNLRILILFFMNYGVRMWYFKQPGWLAGGSYAVQGLDVKVKFKIREKKEE